MFCNQCEQTAKGTGCTIRGVCGKLDIVAGAQDALVQSLRLLAAEILKSGKADQKADDLLLAGLFSTLTNVNFDAVSLKKLIGQVLDERNALKGVNSDTAPFNSGLIVYIILLAASIIWGVYESYTEKSRKRMNI